MPDFPYTPGRNWVNEEDGPTSTDPVADDEWFEAVEAAIHQGQDDEKEAGASLTPALYIGAVEARLVPSEGAGDNRLFFYSGGFARNSHLEEAQPDAGGFLVVFDDAYAPDEADYYVEVGGNLTIANDQAGAADTQVEVHLANNTDKGAVYVARVGWAFLPAMQSAAISLSGAGPLVLSNAFLELRHSSGASIQLNQAAEDTVTFKRV